jgi:SNF2 family DNA or RNA helicase
MTERKHYTPRPYGQLATEFIANRERCCLWAAPGMGKTVIAETLLGDMYSVGGETHPTLVLAPLRVARKTWTAEALKWEHLSGLDVVPIVGDAGQRTAALKIDAPVYATNYDNLVWLRQHLGDRWPFRTIIADEATRLKSFRTKQGGVRAHALAEVAHTHTRRFIELTGTPSSNGLKDLWGQLYFIDAGQRLGRTYSAFEERWFGYKRVKDAISNRVDIQPVIFPHAQAEIQDRLKDVCLTLDPRDWFDLKEPIVNVVTVDLPPKVRSKYREMEKEFYTQINGHEIEAFNAASKSQKLLQLASGAVYVDPTADSDEHPRAKAWTEVHDEKLQALESIVNESGGMPVLVAYHFKSDLARLLKWFPQGRALQTQTDEDDFKAGKVPLLFAHPQSAGHGIDGFQNVSNVIVFFSHWWALENHDQIIERIGPVRQLQAGFDRAVFIHYIVAAGTIDEQVIDRHVSKRSVQEILLEAMKGKKL